MIRLGGLWRGQCSSSKSWGLSVLRRGDNECLVRRAKFLSGTVLRGRPTLGSPRLARAASSGIASHFGSWPPASRSVNRPDSDFDATSLGGTGRAFPCPPSNQAPFTAYGNHTDSLTLARNRAVSIWGGTNLVDSTCRLRHAGRALGPSISLGLTVLACLAAVPVRTGRCRTTRR